MESNNNNNMNNTNNNNQKDNLLPMKNSSIADKSIPSENEIDKTFPSYIIGNVEYVESSYLGVDKTCFLELDSKNGKIKRYANIAEYPNNPTDIYNINNLKSLIKIKKDSNIHTFQLIIDQNETLKSLTFKINHTYTKTKWFDSIKKLYFHYKNGKSVKFNNDTLFIDDVLGIAHYLSHYKRHIINIKEKTKLISIKDFDILQTIGYGAFSTVFKVKHKKSGKIYAMKVTDKNIIIARKNLHYIMTEFNVLKKLKNCPFILKLHCAFQSVNYLYLIVDYCSKGNIVGLQSIKNKKLLYAELLLAIEYLHRNNIIYRDLKPENILLDEDGHIKLCDFNLAKEEVQNNERAYSFCGSLLYLSPETTRIVGAGKPSDIFAIGLIMYEIETGTPAFYADSVEEVYDKIRSVNIDFIQIKNNYCIDLLTKILLEDEDDRFTIQKIKEHNYFQKVNWDKVLNKEHGKIDITKSLDNWRANLDDREQRQMLNIKKIKKQEIIRDYDRTDIVNTLDFYYVSQEFEKEIID